MVLGPYRFHTVGVRIPQPPAPEICPSEIEAGYPCLMRDEASDNRAGGESRLVSSRIGQHSLWDTPADPVIRTASCRARS
jgi:hypothetical protein